MKNKWPIVFTMLFIGLLMWVLNYLTPEFMDDYMYKFIFFDYTFDLSRPVQTFGDVLSSQYHHYFGLNGRTIVHLFVQTFTGILGKPLFNLCNAAVFVAFVYLLTRMSTKINVLNLCFNAALILCLFPAFGEEILWMTGSINYMWSAMVVCLWLICLKQQEDRPVAGKHLMYGLLSVLVGWTHEGITMPLAASLLVDLYVRRKTICKQASFPLMIGFIVGAFLCSFSPGTIARSGLGGGLTMLTFLQKTESLLRVCVRLKVFPVFVLTLLMVSLGSKGSRRQWLAAFYRNNRTLCNATLFSFGVVFLSGFWSMRSAIGIELFSFILLLRAISLCDLRSIVFIKQIICIGGGILYALLLCLSIPNYRAYQNMLAQIAERKSDVIIYRENHIPNILGLYVIRPVIGPFDYNDFWNQKIAAVYHYDRIAFVPKMIYDDIVSHNEKITDISKQQDYPFYVVPLLDTRGTVQPFFELHPTDYDRLPFYVRPFAPRLERYAATEVPASKFGVLNIQGQPYLFVGRNEMIDNRVKAISVRGQGE